MTKTMYKILPLIFMLLLQACGSNDDNNSLESISYTPEQDYLITERNITIEATGLYSDGTSKNVNSLLEWKSSNSSIATVNSDGVISAKDQEGSVTITYSTVDKLPSGEPIITKTIDYKVVNATLESIAISVSKADLVVDQESTLKVNGTFDLIDSKQSYPVSSVEWSSSNEEVVTVSSSGVIKGISEGSALITAKESSTNLTSTISVTVQSNPTYKSIEISSDSKVFNKDETIQLKAVGTNQSDVEIVITESVVWNSSDTDVITISKTGLATAKKIGESNITATLDDNLSSTKLSLSVYKDKYLRLTDITDTDTQLEFPYICNYNMSCKETIIKSSESGYIILKKFKLEAVGQDFTINNLKITDFDGTTSLLNTTAQFDGISNGLIIKSGKSVDFTIESYASSIEKELVYSFSVNSETVESFIGSYSFKTE